MPHTLSDCFKPPPNANLAICDRHKLYNQSESSSVIGVKLKYTEISTGHSVSDLVTPISPRKAHLFNFPDIAFTSEILVGEEVSVKANAPYPVSILVKVLHGEVKLCHSLQQNTEHEILISDELAPIYFLTEILTIEAISKFAILTIAAFFYL
jgi:hypothetical protein